MTIQHTCCDDSPEQHGSARAPLLIFLFKPNIFKLYVFMIYIIKHTRIVLSLLLNLKCIF